MNKIWLYVMNYSLTAISLQDFFFFFLFFLLPFQVTDSVEPPPEEKSAKSQVNKQSSLLLTHFVLSRLCMPPVLVLSVNIAVHPNRLLAAL